MVPIMNQPTGRFGILSSSVNPEQLSTTVQAIAKVVAGMLVFVGVFTAADATSLLSNVNQLITDVMALVPLAYAIWNIAEVIFGLLRKGIVALSAKY